MVQALFQVLSMDGVLLLADESTSPGYVPATIPKSQWLTSEAYFS